VIDFSQNVRRLSVFVDGKDGGELVRTSQYQFTYSEAATLAVSLIMPVEDREFRDSALFAAMDMNLPEGFLLAQLRDRSPKAPPTEMQLLALMGANGIGRVAYRQLGEPPRPIPPGEDRARLLREGAGQDGKIFNELVEAYLATGSGLSGVQPKIVVPERGTVPIPNLILKVGGPSYPGVTANEFLCLQVAERAGMQVPRHDLSDDGQLLVIDRFDLAQGGARLGFEDIAALLDLRVGGALSTRKYKGSYEDIASVLRDFCTDKDAEVAKFFDDVALTVMLRNGDGHLKNYGVVYDAREVWLAPVYDVITTTLYPYDRAGVEVIDRTMALKLKQGDRRERHYPTRDELLAFGRDVCGVDAPVDRIEPIADAMNETLDAARQDDRIPAELREQLSREWRDSIFAYHLSGGRSAPAHVRRRQPG
jgi:serine/threonine-protein kinase HipA